MQARSGIYAAFAFFLLKTLAAGQVTYQGTIPGSDGSSATVKYTVPTAATTQTTIDLRNVGKKISSGTIAITPLVEQSTGNSPPIIPVTQPSASGTGTSGAAIEVTNRTGPLFPMEGVFVNCHRSAFTDAQLLAGSIVWNFGDPSSAYNVMHGWSAAHSYAVPGTYTISLTITLAGGSISTAATNITVQNDIRSVLSLANGASLQKLASGNVYSLSPKGSYGPANLNDLTHVLIIGNGATIKGNGNNSVSMNSGTLDCTLSNVTLTTTGGDNDACDIAGNGNTFLNCNAAGLTDIFNLNQNPTNVLIQSVVAADANPKQDANSISGYFAWVQGTEVNIVGCTCANTLDQANIRCDQSGATGGDACTDVNVSYSKLAITSPTGKNCITWMWSNYNTSFMNTCTGGPEQTGPLGDVAGSGATANAELTNTFIDSETIVGNVLRIDPQTIGLRVANCLLRPKNTFGIWINSTETFGDSLWQVQNVEIDHNTLQSSDAFSGMLFISGGESKNVSFHDNVFDAPAITLGDAQNAYIYDANADLKSFTGMSGNVWSKCPSSSWTNGGQFCVGNGQNDATAWYSLDKFEALPLSGGGNPIGDLVQDISFGATFQVGSAGSNLPAN